MQPPGDETEHLQRLPVQPLRVIDQPDQRPLGGGVREQRQRPQADQEPVRRRPGGQAER
jgi:hypothetical protein